MVTSLIFTENNIWLCPVGVYFITLSASGGGSGGSAGVAGISAGNNGKPGLFIALNNVPVIPGTIYTIIIGIGGSGGVSGRTNPTIGGDTTFSGNGLMTITTANGNPSISSSAGGAAGGRGASGIDGSNLDGGAGSSGFLQISYTPNITWKQDISLVGVVNGINVVFTIPSGTWIQDSTYKIIVYKNGVKQVLGDDYMISSPGAYNTIIFTVPPANSPSPADVMTADYYVYNS